MNHSAHKRIAVINGHPSKSSFNAALAHAYAACAAKCQAQVDLIEVGQLDFDPNLKNGYEQRMELEPDLMDAWQKIELADHLVWIFPVWWGGLPAAAKGFIDRVFLPGRAFSYYENSNRIKGHLLNKTARIITTLDQPGWMYKWYFGEPSTRQLKKTTLEFCGVKKIKTVYIGAVRGSSELKREKWLKLMEECAKQDCAQA
ncbi:NAD(P)H-dependent oxidoreductase [Acinetobacter sp.]|uniref:NAD(P)H-dependent oxidoreductase n=1 Tax=Acinetobacter sp. TaxID=472 RepID=UPI002FCBD7EC